MRWDSMEGLCWSMYWRSCSDDRTHTAGFQGGVKSASDAAITCTHCMIHWEALVAKTVSPSWCSCSRCCECYHLHKESRSEHLTFCKFMWWDGIGLQHTFTALWSKEPVERESFKKTTDAAKWGHCLFNSK